MGGGGIKPVIPALWEVEAGGSRTQGYCWIHKKFEVNPVS